MSKSSFFYVDVILNHNWLDYLLDQFYRETKCNNLTVLTNYCTLSAIHQQYSTRAITIKLRELNFKSCVGSVTDLRIIWQIPMTWDVHFPTACSNSSQSTWDTLNGWVIMYAWFACLNETHKELDYWYHQSFYAERNTQPPYFGRLCSPFTCLTSVARVEPATWKHSALPFNLQLFRCFKFVKSVLLKFVRLVIQQIGGTGRSRDDIVECFREPIWNLGVLSICLVLYPVYGFNHSGPYFEVYLRNYMSEIVDESIKLLSLL